MNLLYRIVRERGAQAGALMLFRALLTIASRAASSSVTCNSSNSWQSSEPGLHLAWKIELRDPFRELTRCDEQP